MGISINNKFGRLLVIKFIERNKHGRKVFECICDCGNVKQITDANLRHSTNSCGCLKKELIKQNYSIDPELKKFNKKEGDRKRSANAKAKNPEKFLEKNRIRIKRYRKKNKNLLAKRHKERLILDPIYLLKRNLRNRFKQALKNNYKNGSAIALLGIGVLEFKKYLEGLFKPGMTWSNYGEWHIDHIFPLSGGDLTDIEFLNKVCHYTNLQPLWEKENLSKGNKIGDK